MSKKTARPTASIMTLKVECSMPPEIHFPILDVWARDPHGIFVIKNSVFSKVTDVIAHADTVRVVLAPAGSKALMKTLSNVRDEIDEKTEKKFKPTILIVPVGVEGSPMWPFIEHRAAHIVEV